MPAAVLFATVFTVGAMGRHSELTAAKAGGLSFYRLMLPVFVAAALATGAGVHRRRDGPRRHGARSSSCRRPSSRASTRARGTTSSTAATRAGSTPSARSTWAPGSSSRLMFERQGNGRRLSRRSSSPRTARATTTARDLAGAERDEPGDRRARQAGELRLPDHAAPRADPVAGRPAGRAEGARRDALRRAGPIHRRASSGRATTPTS